MITSGFVGEVWKEYCTACEGKREYKIESHHVGYSDHHCSFGAGLPVTQDKCSGCGAVSPKGISSDIVGDCW